MGNMSEQDKKISRTELLVLLLYVPGAKGIVGEEIQGKVRLTKLFFLLLKDANLERLISEKTEFKPYKYGPFDESLYDEINALRELGVIEIREPPTTRFEEIEGEYEEDIRDNSIIKLTEYGMMKAREISEEIPKDILKKIMNIKATYNSLPLIELLHYVYAKYPEYAKYSEAKL